MSQKQVTKSYMNGGKNGGTNGSFRFPTKQVVIGLTLATAVSASTMPVMAVALDDYQPPDVGGPPETRGAGTRYGLTRPVRGSSNGNGGRFTVSYVQPGNPYTAILIGRA
jgi:hypothetical protein